MDAPDDRQDGPKAISAEPRDLTIRPQRYDPMRRVEVTEEGAAVQHGCHLQLIDPGGVGGDATGVESGRNGPFDGIGALPRPGCLISRGRGLPDPRKDLCAGDVGHYFAGVALAGFAVLWTNAASCAASCFCIVSILSARAAFFSSLRASNSAAVAG